ncbi:helix-turn-helix domain-containing protein [Pseudomonas aeruginosa]|uniref:AlbA family DNA-binding domain-containing protein n=1 Tax=Pseudomonas aeruginosa TaxID=287 RepID=UPI000453AC89|nr:ATP-binding protein [Pseudomonas aeruginosa]ELK4925497.1 ATP-binding protein [Pseudomonas aeruginosa]ELP1326006.1 ATP-binding protein [Pseudomonas aeruginosa]ELP1329999.1 ATP-binding protein [Pseudomonas aeruginosa]EZN97869.1 hypothetical protein AJ66_05298 [Pseudomonas aeruginosa 3579]EZO10937.1 hypothetical protein AJ65_04314 [Pseudomonas aeruginosa 3578]
MNKLDEPKKPFYETPLNDINEDDLDQIKHLEEGWFIEFKSNFTDTSKIAKSISSFANTYGGLIIIGVQEAPKGRKFGSYSPLSEDEAEATIARLRDAAVSHIQPCPFFVSRKIKSPDSSDHDEKKWIVIVKVPKSDRAPHLHSSGAIYTRKGDSSSPTTLTDQGLLERLWSDRAQKTREIENRIKFLHKQSSSSIPKIDIFITKTLDSKPKDPDDYLKFDKFLETASRRHLPSAQPIFNTFYPLERSYVARRIENSPEATGIMWEYDWDWSIHHIQIPLPCHEWDGEKFNESILGNERVESLKETPSLRNKLPNQKTLIIDTTPVLLIISILFFMVFKIQKIENNNSKLRINMKVSSVRNAAIYSSLPEFKKQIEELGIPIIYRDIGFFNDSMNPDRWLEFDPTDNISEKEEHVSLELGNSLRIFARILQMLGISTKVIFGHYDLSHVEANENELIELFKKVTLTNHSFSSVSNPSVTQ